IRFISHEADAEGAGNHAVMRRLSEVLFIQALRVWASRADHEEGLLAALADPELGESLGQIHAEPANDWSLETLARAAGLSRTVFAERFKQVMGLPPMQYVTLWRMQRARLLLAEGEQTLEHIAELVGYESAAALSRVFKRWVGEPPGSYRRRARAIG
ncbi:MAG: AraC family transcriptional regulator, partial [Moorea sp. SIOASIH]|uniref:helix-turn-helix transcriptional regulator n=1 Tax=Moorena sp. SIOASIH TaxID=2607817 RepID=UPI0013B7B8C4